MEEIKKVYKTLDYEQFKFMKGNRDVRPAHVSNLINSMKRKQLICPIIVNDKKEIIDGQHRYFASKELKLPIYFIINENYGFEEVVMLNENQKNWSSDDFLNHYVSMNNKYYVKLKDFMKSYKLSLGISLIMVTGSMPSTDKSNTFKLGQFSFNQIQYTLATEMAKKYSLIRDFWSFSSMRSFVGAFVNMLQHKDFDFNRFYDCVDNYAYLIEKRTTMADYSRLFQKVYNYNRRNKVRLVKEELK